MTTFDWTLLLSALPAPATRPNSVRPVDHFHSLDSLEGEPRPPLTPEGGEALDAVVISDLHLGSDNCQAKEAAAFLQLILDGDIRTRRLVINGDVFDSIDF